MENKKPKKMMELVNELLFNQDLSSLLNINIHIINKNNLPAIQLRKISTDMEVIKQITLAAMNEKPVLLMPRFRDKLKGINSMRSKGIIFFDDDSQEYKFNF